MDQDSKLISEAYTEGIRDDSTKKKIDDAILECWYRVNALSRRPDAPVDVAKHALETLKNLLDELRYTSNPGPKINPN